MKENAAILVKEVPGQIWSQERNLWFSGVRLRSRTTIVRLADGRLWVHSPAPPTEQVCQQLDLLGEVGWIVVPNRFHHLNAAAMKAKYPAAKVVGPASIESKNPELVLDYEVSEQKLASTLVDFRILPLAGAPFLEETVFYHHSSQTLVAADLVMCGCSKDHWTWRYAARICGQYNRFKVPPDVRLRTRRGKALTDRLEQIASLPMARILLAHSDPIEDRPAEQLRAAWRFALA